GKRTAPAAAQTVTRPAAAPDPGLEKAASRRPTLEPVDAFSPEELDPLTPTTPKRPDPFEHALGQSDQPRAAAGGAGPRATAGLAQLKNAQAVAEIVREQSDYYHATKTTIFNALMNTIDLAQLAQLDQKAASEEIRDIVSMSVAEQEHLVQDILNDVLGYGPLEPLLARDDIADIMVNGAGRVFIEVGGKVQLTNVRFRDNTQLMNICQRIVSQVGRRVD